MSTTINVAILGCGPAGLLAAEGALAAADRKNLVSVGIYSLKRRSDIRGAQYFHEQVDGVTYGVPHDQILYYKMGTAAGYAMKVYGDARAPVSWDHFEQGLHPGWEMEKIYSRLWRRWEKHIIPQNFNLRSPSLDEWAFAHRSQVVISTVPLPQVCRNPVHRFPTRDIWITDRAWPECPENAIVYNGDSNDDWYRTSNLFGHESTEFSHPVEGAVKGVKVLNTNCDCFDHMEARAYERSGLKVVMQKAGRWGRWERGVLVHTAHRDARSAVERYMEGVA